ncbi:MAG: proline racemase family protein, partial [Actinomycetota bacterium]
AAADLADLGVRITAAANDQLGFRHPWNPDWAHISFCQIAGPLERTATGFALRSTTVIDPGKLDRSPTGTGVSARLALLHARGLADRSDTLHMRSVLGSEFVGTIDGTVADIGDGRPAIHPSISGRAWITGVTHHLVDPDDPWPTGYRIADTWPGA